MEWVSLLMDNIFLIKIFRCTTALRITRSPHVRSLIQTITQLLQSLSSPNTASSASMTPSNKLMQRRALRWILTQPKDSTSFCWTEVDQWVEWGYKMQRDLFKSSWEACPTIITSMCLVSAAVLHTYFSIVQRTQRKRSIRLWIWYHRWMRIWVELRFWWSCKSWPKDKRFLIILDCCSSLLMEQSAT